MGESSNGFMFRHLSPLSFALCIALSAAACGDDGGSSSATPDGVTPLSCETDADCGAPNACTSGTCVDFFGEAIDATAACEPGTCGSGCLGCPAGEVCVSDACADSADPEVCPTLGMPALQDAAATYDARKSKTIRRIHAVSSDSAPWDTLEIILREGSEYSYAGEGTYDLSGQDYGTCSTCVIAQKNCQEVGCVRQFFVNNGTLVIEKDGGPNGELTASLHGVIMDEVYIDSKTESAIVMPTGSPWCLPEIRLTAQMADITQESKCDPAGTGTGIDKRVGDFGLTNCLGLVRDLHDGCGDTKAFWFMAVAGW